MLLLLALFLTALAARERDNRFCIACHLHEEKLGRLVAAAPSDLAGAHHAADRQVGCIACHGGADPVMRARVWIGAGFDTLRFLAGTYREPTAMRLALRDRECRQCHAPVRPAGAPAPASGFAFHAIQDHDAVDVRCVRCHTTHTTDGDAGAWFLSRDRMAPICRDCHPEL